MSNIALESQGKQTFQPNASSADRFTPEKLNAQAPAGLDVHGSDTNVKAMEAFPH